MGAAHAPVDPLDGRRDASHQPDQSVLVEGANGEKCANRLLAPADLTGITGVRLEALTDERLPQKGPGRADDGNFVLTELVLGTSSLDQIRLQQREGAGGLALDAVRLVDGKQAEFAQVKLQNAQADFSQANYPVASAIDGKTEGNDNGWAVAPEGGKEHVAVFETADDYIASGAGLIRAELIHNFSTGKHSLGRFRVSITRSPRPLSIGPPSEIAALLAVNADARTAPQQQQLVEYYLSQEKEYVDQNAQLAEAEKPVPPDAETERIKELVARLSKPLPIDAKLAQLATWNETQREAVGPEASHGSTRRGVGADK